MWGLNSQHRDQELHAMYWLSPPGVPPREVFNLCHHIGKKGCSNRPHWFWWLKQVEVYFQLWESPGQVFTDGGPGRSDSRNQASSVLWHHHPQATLLRLPSGSPASQPKGPDGGPHREDLGSRPGGHLQPAGFSYPIGYNSVTWPHWASRGAGKCGLGLWENQEIGIRRVHIHFLCYLCVLRSCFCVESSTVEFFPCGWSRLLCLKNH